MTAFQTQTFIPSDGNLSIALPEYFWGTDVELSVAKKEATAESAKRTPQPGCMKGKIWIADDFDAPLEDFREYME